MGAIAVKVCGGCGTLASQGVAVCPACGSYRWSTDAAAINPRLAAIREAAETRIWEHINDMIAERSAPEISFDPPDDPGGCSSGV